jgi:Flp pilus assembly protein TadG
MLARIRPPRRGASTVEFAVVAPVLFLLVVGIVEVGRLVMVAQLATNGSREAARFAAQASATTTAVEEYARTYLTAAGLSSESVTSVAVEQLKGGNWEGVADLKAVSTGTPVRVTVSVDFDRASWLPSRFFVGDATAVTGTTVMRRE